MNGKASQGNSSPGGQTAARFPPVTFLVMTYCQEHYVGACIDSVLAQDYPNLRIVISDDASTDATQSIIAEKLAAYEGPHVIRFERQPKNLRAHHLNALRPLWQGSRFVVLGAGDDIYYPHRVTRAVERLLAEGTSVATANAHIIDPTGAATGDLMVGDDERTDLSMQTLCRELTNRACFGAGLTWDRRVFSIFGKLMPGPRQLDQIVVFRAMLLDGVSLIREPLFQYRLHDANLSMRQMGALAKGDEHRSRLVEERRRGNVLATAVVFRDLLQIAREKCPDQNFSGMTADEIDALLLEAIHIRARGWARWRAELADDNIGIY